MLALPPDERPSLRTPWQEPGRNAWTAGMDDFLTKPIQPKLLTETLNRWAAAVTSKLEIA